MRKLICQVWKSTDGDGYRAALQYTHAHLDRHTDTCTPTINMDKMANKYVSILNEMVLEQFTDILTELLKIVPSMVMAWSPLLSWVRAAAL